MKLLYFVIQMDQLGGVARIVTDKVNWLSDRGYDVTICDIEDWDVVPYYELNSSVKFRIGHMQTTPGGIFRRLQGVWRAIGKVFQIIKEENPDVIVNAHCPLVTWILPFLKFPGIGFFERLRPILITEMHQSRYGLDVFNQKFMSPLGRRLHRWSIRWIYGKYDKFVVLTNGDKEQWNLKNSEVIPNFVTVKDEVAVKEECCERKQIIMLARLMPQKRIDLMIEVWAKLAKDFPDWHVKVLGEGMERSRLEGRIRDLGIVDSFLLPGGVKDVMSELKSSDILCMTSEYEGFPLALIEGALNRLPLIAFEFLGIQDIINDGVDGLIIPFGKVDEYAEKLCHLMHSHDDRFRLGVNAQSSAKRFEKEAVMQKWVSLFNGLF